MATEYDEIINLPHPVSSTHKRMALIDRAAQFAPFAALTGYGAAIQETGRLTDRKLELDESEKSILNEKLSSIAQREKSRPTVRFTYFLADEHKSGGAYIDVEGEVRRVDPYTRTVRMTDGTEIPFDDILKIDADFA